MPTVPDPVLRRVIVVFAVPLFVYTALWMLWFIQNVQDRALEDGSETFLFMDLPNLPCIISKAYSFQIQHGSWRHREECHWELPSDDTHMAGRQEVNSSFLHRRKFLFIVGSGGVTSQHVRVSTESYS